ncbi:MAG: hypothetical protein DRG30_02440 [Epsilonproteobacteria bacterium]|nr:MAG: hypothetical protein DRG30_02440 [Campylobacterota bacterium]
MQQAFSRGMDGLILRPGNIFLNTDTGVSSPMNSNFALLMMRAYIDTGLAPDLDIVFEAVGVNQLAEAMVSVTLGQTNKTMLNLSNPNEISLKDYVEMLSEVTSKQIEIVPFDEWKERAIKPLKEGTPLFPLTLYFQDDTSEELMHFDTSLTQIELKKHGIYFNEDYKELFSNAFEKTFKDALGL